MEWFDSIFKNEEFGNTEFVNSTTAKSGKTRKMIYGEYAKDCKYLQKFKEKLMQRKIKKFNENNWWEWRRAYYKSDLKRIYLNIKTCNKKPFLSINARLMMVQFWLFFLNLRQMIKSYKHFVKN